MLVATSFLLFQSRCINLPTHSILAGRGGVRADGTRGVQAVKFSLLCRHCLLIFDALALVPLSVDLELRLARLVHDVLVVAFLEHNMLN